MEGDIVKLLLVLLLPILVHSSELTQKLPFMKKWMSTSSNNTKAFRRMILSEKAIFPVADIIYQKLPSNEKTDFSKLKEDLEKAYGIKFFHRTIGQTHSFSSHWLKGAKEVKVFVTQKNDYLITSTSSYRLSYGNQISTEIEVIHRLLHQSYEKPKKKVSLYHSLSDFFLSHAYAQSINCADVCGGLQLCYLICIQNGGEGEPLTDGNGNPIELGTLTDLIDALNSITGGLDRNNQTLKEQTDLILAQSDFLSRLLLNNTNQYLKDILDQVGISSNDLLASIDDNSALIIKEFGLTRDQILDATNDQVNKILETFGVTRDQLLEGVDKLNLTAQNGIDVLKTESDEWQEIIKRLGDPDNIRKTAAISTVIAVLGGFATNLVLSGVKSLVTLAARWISGDLKKMKREELVEEFKKARESYEKTQDEIKKVAESIDLFFLKVEMADQIKKGLKEQGNENLDLNNIEELLNYFKVEKLVQQKKINQLLERFEKIQLGTDYEKEFAECVVQEQNELKEIEKHIGALESYEENKKSVCQMFKEKIATILKLESSLQHMRAIMADNEEAVLAQLEINQLETAKRNQEVREDAASDARKKKRSSQSNNKKLLRMSNEEGEFLIYKTVRSCKHMFISEHEQLSQAKLSKEEKKLRKAFCDETIFSQEFREDPLKVLSENFPIYSQKDSILYTLYTKIKELNESMGNRTKKSAPDYSNFFYMLNQAAQFQTVNPTKFEEHIQEIKKQKEEDKLIQANQYTNYEAFIIEQEKMREFFIDFQSDQSLLFKKLNDIRKREKKLDEICDIKGR